MVLIVLNVVVRDTLMSKNLHSFFCKYFEVVQEQLKSEKGPKMTAQLFHENTVFLLRCIYSLL